MKPYNVHDLGLMAHDINHYPIRRRGEKRRINPNLEGIAWLEWQSRSDTHIASTTSLPGGLLSLRTRGQGKSGHTLYVRPMISLLHSEMFSGMRMTVRPCPNCDDWARTSKCADHPDEGLVSQEVRDQRYSELAIQIHEAEYARAEQRDRELLECGSASYAAVDGPLPDPSSPIPGQVCSFDLFSED